MKVRNSFLVRWLLTVNETQSKNSVLDAEHIQSGDKFRTNSVEELNHWMEKISVNSVNNRQFINSSLTENSGNRCGNDHDTF